MNQFQAFHQKYLAEFNHYLDEHLRQEIKQPELQAGMLYSVEAGGKRLRPFLLLATLKTCAPQVNPRDYFRVAGAIELLHTYSLIHDDLPEMDNDDYRRGHLTNHKKFTVGRAVLAGDGLLTHAFSWLATTKLTAALQVKLIQILAQAAGPQQMVAGQMTDIVHAGEHLSVAQVEQLDAQKTGALITAAVLMGAYCGQASPQLRQQLQIYAQNFGLAFQIYDDLLDLRGNAKQLGKAVGKDQAAGKNTCPEVLGLKAARAHLTQALAAARAALELLPNSTVLLEDALAYFDLGAVQ